MTMSPRTLTIVELILGVVCIVAPAAVFLFGASLPGPLLVGCVGQLIFGAVLATQSVRSLVSERK